MHRNFFGLGCRQLLEEAIPLDQRSCEGIYNE